MKLKNWKSIAIGFLLLTSFACQGDSSPWLWEIDGKKTTVKDFEQAYESHLTLFRDQLQSMAGRVVTKEELEKLLEHPELAGNEQLSAILANTNKERFWDDYQMMKLINVEAKKKGFLKKPEVRQTLQYLEEQYVANMYLTSLLSDIKIDISEQEAVAEWERRRKSIPGYRSIPIDQGIEYVRQQIYQQRLLEKRAEILKKIERSYATKENDDPKAKAFLNQEKVEDKTENPAETPEASTEQEKPATTP